jgi:hypothetical protein
MFSLWLRLPLLTRQNGSAQLTAFESRLGFTFRNSSLELMTSHHCVGLVAEEKLFFPRVILKDL